MATEDSVLAGEWFAGEDKALQFNIVDAASVAKVMTGWSLSYSFADQAGGPALFTKTTGSGIAIGNGAGTDTRATVTVDRADTLNLRPGVYYQSLWRTDSANDTVLSYGAVVLSGPAKQ